MRLPGKLGIAVGFFAHLAFSSAVVQAQTAEITVDGLPVQPLIGEEFCATVNFRNSAPNTTGYGPYVIGVFSPGMGNATVTFVDVPPDIEYIGEFDSSGMLVDPVSGATITGDPGDVAYLARYPVGSLDYTDDAILQMQICAEVEPGADIGQDLPVEFYGNFEFGDSPTGQADPADLVGPTSGIVTPQLARVEKTNTAPEGERPPGPSHPYEYVWTMDISDQITIESIALTDALPPEILWTGTPVSVAAPLGQGCVASVTPNAPDTSGVQVEVDCTAVTGTTATDDLVVTVEVYIDDILDESMNNASETITNTVQFDYAYTDSSNTTTNYQNSDTSDVLAIPAAIQKTVSGSADPGGALEYTINFQVTDYPLVATGGATSFVVTDVLPDGLTYDATLSLVVDGMPVASVSPTETPGPNAGETTLSWDIGTDFGATVPNGSDGQLVYTATVNDTYADGSPVVANDVLTNNAGLDYTLDAGGSGDNGSAAPATVTENLPVKTMIAPSGGMTELQPGQQVTFRLEMAVPAGQTDAVVLTDILPRPIFDVSTVTPATDIVVSANPPVPPVSGDPFFDFGLAPSDVTLNTAQNAIIVNVGDIDSNQPVTVGVDITVTVSSEPFADNLYLTNLFLSSYESSGGTAFNLVNAAVVLVGAPELVVTKGVLELTDAAPTATISPAPPADPFAALADSNATGLDAGDTVTYAITVENIGGQSAYNVTVTDPAVAGLTCNYSSTSVSVGGASVTFSGSLETGLTIDGSLAANDENPAGPTFGAPYSDDTAVIQVECETDNDVHPGQSIVNTASVVWTATQSSSTFFPEVTDDASISINRPTLIKQLDGVDPGYTGSPNVSVGEIVSYELRVIVPEGESVDVLVNDLLDTGLAFIDVLSVSGSRGGISTDASGGFAGVAAGVTYSSEGGAASSPDRRLQLDLGTITNSNADNPGNDAVVITYRAKVLNAAVNTNGVALRNTATASWDESGQRATVQTQAPPVKVVEPDLLITKTFSRTTGDNTTPPQVLITLEHSGNSSAPAYDVTLEDVMPTFVDAVVGTLATNCSIPNLLTSESLTPDLLEATLDEFPPGATCTLEFDTSFEVNLPAGYTVHNCADVQWTSTQASDTYLNDAGNLPPNNTLDVERTGDSADPGELNDYFAENCADFSIYDIGVVKSVTSTSETQTDNLPDTPTGAESLTIGERVTFEIVVSIPEASSVDLAVSDILPTTNMILRLDGMTVTAVGNHLDPLRPNPPLDLEDTNGDGLNDQGSFDFGLVGHTILDGSTDPNDQIVIEVNATVMDVAENANNDLDANYGVATFRPNKVTSGLQNLDLVEPLLQIVKTADVSGGQAGDIVNYTVAISHTGASRVDAENLTLSDVLPQMELNLQNASWGEGACNLLPDSLTGDTGANSVTAEWASFPLGSSCEITFAAEINSAVVTGDTLTNTGEIEWTSLQDPNAPGSEESRFYDANDSWDVVVTLPGLYKRAVATDSDDTPFTPGNPVTQLTIGESVTFLIDADMPDAVTPDVTIYDRLPTTGVVLEITETELVNVGTDVTYTSGITPPAPADTCNADNTQCSWYLGDVTNAPDTRPDPDVQDQVVLRVKAIVVDDPDNSGVPGQDDNLPNTAEFDSPAIQLQDQAIFDIVEPLLEIEKLTQSGGKLQAVDPNEVHTFTLQVSHTADSTAAARQIEIIDTLDADMRWVNDSTVSTTCPALTTNSSGTSASGGGMAVFTFDSLPVAVGSCQISFDVRMNASLTAPQVFPNRVSMTWESKPMSTQSRIGTDDSNAALFTLVDAFLDKQVVATSVDQTGAGMWDPNQPDATIGEIVEYDVTAYFADGVTVQGVTLTDTLDPGLSLVSATVLSMGKNLSSTDNVVTQSGNTISVFYGDVTNGTIDGVTNDDDKAIFRVRAMVQDIGANTSGVDLGNTAQLDYQVPQMGGGTLPVTLNALALVDVVEPILETTKTFTDYALGVATITLEVTNTGDAPAFDLEISDDFDTTYWLPGITPVSVPSGFTLMEQPPAGGFITVTLATDNAGATPSAAQILSPGESLQVVFSMNLVNSGVLPGVSSIDNIADGVISSLPDGDNLQPNDPNDERVVTDDGQDQLLFPQLELTKAWGGPNNPAQPGDTITYTLELTNTGSAPATQVVITDTPDPIATFQAGSVAASDGTVVQGNTAGDTSIEVQVPQIAPSATVTVTYNVAIPVPYPDSSVPELLTNQAEASSTETLPVISDDSATAADDDPTVVVVVADPVMTVTKNDQRAIAPAGSTISYLIQYGNTGNQDATGVTLTETVPANTSYVGSNGWMCTPDNTAGSSCTFNVGNLAGAGGSGSVLFEVEVDDPLPANVTEIDNTVVIEEDGDENAANQTPANPASTASDDEITPVIARPILTITKTDGGISVVPGQIFAYTLIFRNTGHQDAADVRIDETVPVYTLWNEANSIPGGTMGWTCASGDNSPAGTPCSLSVGTVSPGRTRVVQYGLRVVDPAPIGATLISNTAHIADNNNMSPTTEDDASDTTPIIAAPDMAVEKRTDTTQAQQNKVIVYQIDYANVGNQDAINAVVHEIVPLGTRFVANDSLPTVWSCADDSGPGTICTYSAGPLAASAGGSLTFAVKVVAEPGAENIVNVVEVNDDPADPRDPNLSNNTDRVVTPFPLMGIPVMSWHMLLFYALVLAIAGGFHLRRRKVA